MNKKAAVELSLNFLVVIIISLVIFSFGVAFIYNILNSSKGLQKMTLEDIDNQLADLSCGNMEKICLSKDAVVLKPTDIEVIGVKIFNIEDATINFITMVSPNIFIDSDGKRYEEFPANLSVLPEERSEELEANEERTIGIGFEIPKAGIPKGTYVYNVKVYRGSKDFEANLYDTIKKIRITVK